MYLATGRALYFKSVEVGFFCRVERLEIRYAVRLSEEVRMGINFSFCLKTLLGTGGKGGEEK